MDTYEIAASIRKGKLPDFAYDEIARRLEQRDKLLYAARMMLADYEDQNGDGFCECDPSVALKCPACFTREAIAHN